MECKTCGSKFGYMRLKSNEWICRICGNTTEMITAKKLVKNFVGIRQ